MKTKLEELRALAKNPTLPKSKGEHELALEIISMLMDDEDCDLLEPWVSFVVAYEDEHYPMDKPTLEELEEFRRDQNEN